jgi:hypothetical protein
MNMFPIAIGDVLDAVEEPAPLPDDSPPPGKDLQLQSNHMPVDSSSNVGTSASRKHYDQNNKNASTSLHSEHSKLFPKSFVSSDPREGGLSSGCSSSQASSSDVTALTRIPRLASPRWKKRRHRGRHRQQSDNVMVTGSLRDDPSPRTAANGSATHLTALPSAASLCDTDTDRLSKSAPCDSLCFVGMVCDPLSWGLESSSAETVPLTAADNADSPTPPQEHSRKIQRSWYTQALPFFSVSLGGDDGVTEV